MLTGNDAIHLRLEAVHLGLALLIGCLCSAPVSLPPAQCIKNKDQGISKYQILQYITVNTPSIGLQCDPCS